MLPCQPFDSSDLVGACIRARLDKVIVALSAGMEARLKSSVKIAVPFFCIFKIFLVAKFSMNQWNRPVLREFRRFTEVRLVSGTSLSPFNLQYFLRHKIFNRKYGR